MSTRSSPVAPQDDAPQDGDRSSPATARSSKTSVAIFFTLGNLLPSFGLFLSLHGTPAPATWQSGKFHDYVTFLLSDQAAALFYPFWVYAIASFTLCLFRPDTLGRHFWLQFGIYTGIVLGIQYCFIVGIILFRVEQPLHWQGILTFLVAIPIAALLTVGLAWLIWRIVGIATSYLRIHPRGVGRVAFLALAAPGLAFLFGGVLEGEDAGDWLFVAVVGPGLILVFATPVWMVLVYSILAYRIHRIHRPRFQFRLARLLMIVTWLAAYMSAWRMAVAQTIKAYSALPTSPPSGCYVATAAAQGHPSVVRSWEVRCDDGSVRSVNKQLAYLKCGELALQALCPTCHHYLRAAYDRIGPPMAKVLRYRLAADLAYWGLKPAEWAVRGVFVCVMPDACKMANLLYRK